MKVFRLSTCLYAALLFVLVACQPVMRRPETPTLIEHKIPTHSAHAGGITVGPDGALWFAETGANQIGRITVAGVVTEYPIPTEDAMDDTQGFVGLGPDGAIWFNEDRVNKLGRIAPDGKITEVDLPKGRGVIRQIVAGADGALWVTALDANKIVKLSTEGKMLAEYTLPKADSRPAGMVVGPDGAFWFIEVGANQIGRITLAGMITEYAIPTANSFPIRLTVGPDNALWFNMFGANKIGRISLEGKITEYDTPGMGPLSLASGADGAIWFTGYNSTEIGRLTTDGVLTKLSIPTYAAVPYHIVAGPDGNLWFTEQQGNQIGQIKLPPSFSSKIYKLPMRVSFGPDWHILDDYPDLVTVAKKQAGWQLKTNIVTNLGFNIVTDAKLADPVEGHLVPFPDDFVSWIKSNPDFAVGDVTEVMVGGIKGIQIDVRSATTENKPFLHLTSGIKWYVSGGSSAIWMWRFILLNDVNGERVLITFPSPADYFQSKLEESQKILDSVVFSKP